MGSLKAQFCASGDPGNEEDHVAEGRADTVAYRKVELAIGALSSLSVLPGVAVQYLSKMLQGRFSPASLESIVECEPAVAVAVLAASQKLNIGPADQRHAMRLVLERMEQDQIRDVLVGMRVSVSLETETAEEQVKPARKDLIVHSLAVACAARRLAEASSEMVDLQMAYTAGLLHDIGKLALQDIMPKSLAAIAKEAELTHANLQTLEQSHLGTNHTLLGRQLARKWRLPEVLAMAIWLHHSDAVALAGDSPSMELARLVWAADQVARLTGLGLSGSYDAPAPLDAIAGIVQLDVPALQEICVALPKEVAEKTSPLGLDTPQPVAKYCELIHATAANLSRKNMELTVGGRKEAAAAGYLTFAREFLTAAGPSLETIDIGEELARRWQRFFQTGSVCLYLVDPIGGDADNAVDAVFIEALGHSHKMVLPVPEGVALVPRPVTERFVIVDAQRHIDWLLEQVEVEFDLSRTKLLPLASEGRIIGILAFELNYPADCMLFAERFETAAAMAGAVLGLSAAKDRQMRWSDQFAQAIQAMRTWQGPAAPAAPTPVVAPPAPREAPPAGELLEPLAEMAAGIAHELNNPLSVISGRAQLLADTETDPQKKQTLGQIQDNARDASAIVQDLMSFAEPMEPRPARTNVHQIIEEAIHLAARKSRIDQINMQLSLPEGTVEVFADSAQIVSALAGVISNAVESYTDPMGPVKITVERRNGDIQFQVNDLGRGMDSEMLRKATHPFFSAKPAGRQRGMGLSYAVRLIQLNHGALTIQSQPSQGTTVTITLPAQ
jgi:putative nucleotidyltransferase with HDIG domain